MPKKFGELLRDCRKKADLTQKDLGRKLHLSDGSMISKFEKGPKIPNSQTLRAIIDQLSNYGVPQTKLDRLWETAGYKLDSDFLDFPMADPIVSVINRYVGSLEDQQYEKKLLIRNLQRIVEVHQDYCTAKQTARQRKWLEAHNLFETLQKEIDNCYQQWELLTQKERGHSLYSAGLIEDSLRELGFALSSAREFKDHREEGYILIRLGNAFRRSGGKKNWDLAIKNYGDAKQIFQELDEKERVVDCLRKIAGTYLFQGLPRDAISISEDSLKLSEKIEYINGIAKALQHLAWGNCMIGNTDEAERLSKKALALIPENKWDEIKALRYLGEAYRLSGKMDVAEEIYCRALDLFKKFEIKYSLKASRTFGLINLGLGKLYLEQPGQEWKAKHHLDKGLEAHGGQGRIGDDCRAIEFYTELGRFWLLRNKINKAKEYLDIASSHFSEIQNDSQLAYTLALLSEFYYKKGKNVKKDFLAEVQAIVNQVTNLHNGDINNHLTKILFIVGKIQADRGAYSTAVMQWCQAEKLALEFNIQHYREQSQITIKAIERVAREATPKKAIQLCEIYEAFWMEQILEPNIQAIVRETLADVAHRKENYKAFETVS